MQLGEAGKHRHDIARIMAIMPANTRVALSEVVRAGARTFLELVEEPSRAHMRNLGLDALTFGDVRERIREVYL